MQVPSIRKRLIIAVGVLVAALPGSTAHAALSTLPYVHDGTACQSTSGTHNLPSGMSQTGVAFDGSRLLLSCWGDTTITAVDPVSGAELQVYAVSGKGLTGNPIRAFGALAYDRASGTLWACASYSTSAKTERNSVEVGIVTLSSGGTGTYTPEFNSKGCINGLAVDPGTATGRAGTLWTSANIATSMYEYSGLPTPGKQIGSAVNVGGLIGYNSGIAVGGGQFYLANPQTTTKKVFSVNASFAASSVTQVLSSSHRYEDMECDDVTFAPQTVIWVMWFNQNVLLPMPISGTCSTAPPPPPALNLGQSSNGPVTVGSNLAFAVTVSDTGASGQTGVWLTDTPPAGTTLVSSVPSQGTCAGSAPVSCSLGSIAAGGTATVTVTVSTATPGQATNAATAQSNTVGPVSNSYSTTIDPAAGTTDVTVGDGGFSPTTVTSPQGGVVAFLFQGTVDHGAADNTGMGLFDSGLMTPGSSFDYSYSAAGTYSVVDSATGHLATVKVPVIAPATGSVGAPLTITYASAALPPGFNADIQVRVPGTTKWVAVASDQAGTSVQYTPKGSGVYKFRSRFQLGTVHASKFSPAISIKVS